MAGPIYYQWQNEHLLRTIYPLREMKLRDFLIYYYEIDVWQEYKDKKPEDLGGEVQAHQAAQRELISNAYDRYLALKSYFEKAEVGDEYRQKFPGLDQDFMEKINRMHREFNRYFPTYNNIAKERYFLTRQITVMEGYRKEIEREIANKQRIVRNMGPDWKKTPEYQQEIEKLKNITAGMANQELENLYGFLAAFVKVEKRRKDLDNWKDKNAKEQAAITSRLHQLTKEKSTLDERLAEIKTDLARLKSPPNLRALEAYFTREDVSADYQKMFPNSDERFIDKINGIHQSFKSYFGSHDNAQQRVFFLKARLSDVERYQREIERDIAEKERIVRNMGETWRKTPEYQREIKTLRNITLKMTGVELIKMGDFLAALEISRKTDEDIKTAIAKKEDEGSQATSQLSRVVQELNSLEQRARQIEEVITRPEKEQLMAFVDLQEVGVRDIVRGKVENYQHTLAEKAHEELLEEVVNKFLANPERYPLWLQYMVIHFSGMRYKSAHGSWADPKDLLFSLKVQEIEKRFKNTDDDTIEALCQERIADYRPGSEQNGGQDQVTVQDLKLPKLAQAQDPQWKAKVEHHLNRLERATYAYHKRKALLDLRIDEESYEIEALGDQEALEKLEGMKAQLPDWMWKEIVRLTDLRLKEVKDENWEELSPEDLAARQEYAAWEYREILDKWKRENLTGWREEHDRANRLIVSRAVCNEVAEHIQHLRGHSPPGGLTAKPEWYLRKEKDPKLAESADRPYFVKPRSQADFKEGASLLWLRYVDSQPNAWQIAHPITLKNGEGLLSSAPSPDRGNFRAPAKRTLSKSKGGGANSQSDWRNHQDSSGHFKRSKTVIGENKKRSMVNQWLRWMHEATVAEVGDTADGPVVLTFETALPYEDKRQSTIGVFKHSAYNLNHNPAGGALTLVGYTPKADVPYEDLKEMLDWNRILRKQVLSEAQMKAFWDKAIQLDQKPVVTAKESGSGKKTPGGTPEQAISPAEVAPAVEMSNHKERIVCYDIGLGSRQASVYQPRVELRRGLRLWVAQGEAVKVGTQIYYPVARCDGEPRAQELYVRAEEIINAPQDRASIPVATKEKLNLRRLSRANKNGKPIMEKFSVQIPAGTKLRVSAVHKVTPADPGNGVIDADGPDDYYLIVECPNKISAEGLFLRTEDVLPISEEAYKPSKAKPPEPVAP
jgi:hypothetical protein